MGSGIQASVVGVTIVLLPSSFILKVFPHSHAFGAGIINLEHNYEKVEETFCTKPLHVVYNTSYIQINNNEITFKVRGFFLHL